MADSQKKQIEEIQLRSLFEETPPNRFVKLAGLSIDPKAGPESYSTPVIQLYCDHKNCGGPRLFRPTSDYVQANPRTPMDQFKTFVCRNCSATSKTFALRLMGDERGDVYAVKFGEQPPFGPHVPSKLITLLRNDNDLFFKGVRCESQGLGIASFSYFRRVVENQKNAIFDEIIRVGKYLNFDAEFIAEIEAAKAQTQFAAAVDSVKHGIPEALKINGKDPLRLLHEPLSIGLHQLSDDECLELATSIRIVLAAFAERIAQALKDDAALANAVNRLAQTRQKANSTSTASIPNTPPRIK